MSISGKASCAKALSGGANAPAARIAMLSAVNEVARRALTLFFMPVSAQSPDFFGVAAWAER
jgi:hypothetical protein